MALPPVSERDPTPDRRASAHAAATAPAAPSPRSRRVDVDTWIARVALLVALSVTLGCGVQNARQTLIYGPIDEVYHVAYIEHVAATGRPPVLGRDTVFHGVDRPGENDTLVRAPEPRGWPTPWVAGERLGQVEAIQPPLYYYLLAPGAWVVSWYHRVTVYRAATIAFVAAGIVLLFLAVRRTAPDRPLAAGLAALVLGTMSGLIDAFSQVQNDGLLLGLFALLYFSFERWRGTGRRAWVVALTGGLLTATQLVAAPAALALALAAARPRVAAGRRRRFVGAAALVAGPSVPWVIWNLVHYSRPWPSAAGQGVLGTPPALGDVLPFARGALREQLEGFWSGRYPPVFDSRPPVVLGALVLVALIGILVNGHIERERMPIATWLSLAALAFASTFFVLMASAVATGGSVSFAPRYFVGVAVAYAALVGLIATSYAPRLWVPRAAVLFVGVALVQFAIGTSLI